MAFKLNQNKKNKGENKSNDKNVKEYIRTQEQLVKKKSKTGKKNKLKSYTVHTRNTSLPLLPTPIVTTMATYYPQNYVQPATYNWNLPALHVSTPVYTLQPLPVVVSPVVVQAPMYPYNVVLTTQIATPVVHSIVTDMQAVNYIYEEQPSMCYGVEYTTEEPTQDNEQYYEVQEENTTTTNVEEVTNSSAQAEETHDPILEDSTITHDEVASMDFGSDPIEIYLSLPRDFFPAPRMLALDPNAIIDEFCKLNNVHNHVPWLLDLEYGVPRSPVTRHIPIYNVYYSSIHCKNTPDAVHPGFDSCDEEFKNVLLLYYDSMISSLYNGYVSLTGDESIDKFQSWLHLPMKVLGMCWP